MPSEQTAAAVGIYQKAQDTSLSPETVPLQAVATPSRKAISGFAAQGASEQVASTFQDPFLQVAKFAIPLFRDEVCSSSQVMAQELPLVALLQFWVQ